MPRSSASIRRACPRNLTLALGTQSVSPLEMATGFAMFANGGFKVEPYYISRIEDSSGKVLFEAEPKIACPECEQAAAPVARRQRRDGRRPDGSPAPHACAAERTAWRPRSSTPMRPSRCAALRRLQGGIGYLPANRIAPRVISPQNAWLMTDIMQDVVQRGTAARARALGRNDLAGKTGTPTAIATSGSTASTAGSSPPSGWATTTTSRSASARKAGAPRCRSGCRFMREALRGVPSSTMPRPGGLIDLKISPYMGTLADPLDPDAIYETFMLEHQPRMPEPGDPGYVPFGAGPDGGGGSEPLF